MPLDKAEWTTGFRLKGAHIVAGINGRIASIRAEINASMDQIATTITRRIPEGNMDPKKVLEEAVGAMLALYAEENATGFSVSIKAHLQRCNQLQADLTELQCIARNLLSDQVYRVSVEEAIKYGLY